MGPKAMAFLFVGICKVGINLYGVFENGIWVHSSTETREQLLQVKKWIIREKKRSLGRVCDRLHIICPVGYGTEKIGFVDENKFYWENVCLWTGSAFRPAWRLIWLWQENLQAFSSRGCITSRSTIVSNKTIHDIHIMQFLESKIWDSNIWSDGLDSRRKNLKMVMRASG